MNNGDLATEKNDMVNAMAEYRAAMQLVPDNLEMQYWTAITLANNHETEQALSMLKKIFAVDKNWKELTRRLPAVKLLTVTDSVYRKIMAR
jgi:cytochrome c-type biogenesis protein CcmH/NrfG